MTFFHSHSRLFFHAILGKSLSYYLFKQETDWYAEVMNLSTPILISDSSEDFRSFLRDMLTKHGFFHLMEASSEEETLRFIHSAKKNIFILIQQTALTTDILNILSHKKNFIVITQKDHPQILTLAALLGIEHILNFPFSSKILLEKISGIQNKEDS